MRGTGGDHHARRAFDKSERERLRAALFAYMEAEGIGVPALQERIAQASGRGRDLIPLKTLQRFLAGTHRTNDGFVAAVNIFGKGVNVRSVLHEFGMAASSFYGQEAGRGDDPGARAFADLAGCYEILGKKTVKPPRGSGVFKEVSLGYKIACGRMDLAKAAGGACLTAREVITNLLRVDDVPREGEGPRQGWEGAVVSVKPVVLVLLRSVLTRLPKTYWLRQDENGDLIGNAAEAVVLPGEKPERGYVIGDDLLFRKIKE